MLRERGVAVVWLGTTAGMEARLVPANGFPMEWVNIGGLRGKGIAALLLAPWRLVAAVAKAIAILRRVRPRVVLGAGGFVSGPGGVAAWALGIPLLIHEQNAVAGLTNRVLARLAREVFEAFPGSFGAGIRAQCIGNPVRADIAGLPAPGERLQGRHGPVRILILGGSQGARALNDMVPQALASLRLEIPMQIKHQAGQRGIEVARSNYAAAALAAEVLPFIDDMAAAYAWADIAICRAGALTITELQSAGLGAVLVPFPAAVDDHQTKNAAVMVAAGAACLAAEQGLDAAKLASELRPLLGDRPRLVAMAISARRQAKTRAAEQLAERCLAYGAAA
jgi:UDP-N-acetylglucosamine--N-acetylmuramyl-(pentapeptide) pyrophosphoryl-undecaprenol N-acetylglucosamine transferase